MEQGYSKRRSESLIRCSEHEFPQPPSMRAVKATLDPAARFRYRVSSRRSVSRRHVASTAVSYRFLSSPSITSSLAEVSRLNWLMTELPLIISRRRRPCNRASAGPKVPPKINISRGEESHARRRDQVCCHPSQGCVSHKADPPPPQLTQLRGDPCRSDWSQTSHAVTPALIAEYRIILPS